MEKKILSPIVAGVLLGLISVIVFLAYYFTGIMFQTGFLKWIPSFISLGLIIYFIIKWANDNNNNVTFGKCFGYGFKIVAMSAIISFFFILIFILITPEFKQQFLETSRDQMNQNSGSANLTDEQKATGLAMLDKMFFIIMLGGSLLGNLFIGALASLIGAAVAKKNPQDPFGQQTT